MTYGDLGEAFGDLLGSPGVENYIFRCTQLSSGDFPWRKPHRPYRVGVGLQELWLLLFQVDRIHGPVFTTTSKTLSTLLETRARLLPSWSRVQAYHAWISVQREASARTSLSLGAHELIFDLSISIFT